MSSLGDTVRRKVALVVDDDPASLMLVSDALEAVGITVMTARDGATALRFVVRLAPDVILLDAVMPGLDGFETCRRLKAPPLEIEAPVIFMTGLSASEHLLEGLGAGGVDYVTKPLQLDALIARIGVHLVNAGKLLAAQQALDATDTAVVSFHPDGRVAWTSPRARQLLSQAATLVQNGRAGGEFAHWLAALARVPLSEAGVHRDGNIIVSYLGTSPTREVLLSLSRRDARPPGPVLAERFGLTEREGDVLFWLTQGKTSVDIGVILGLSWRTVNKHLEQVFQKMGVDNRTSAAVMADRVLSLQ